MPAATLPAPAPCDVPHFAPLRIGGVRHRWRRSSRRRLLAAGLAMAAAAWACGAFQDTGRAAPAAGCRATTAPGER
ncbi:hypothetical protein [Streptomyces sp. NPDC048644]|uniref:hypothetical protein n=1 Tax=Streptomyces sp. NPDC048644 TaxID=3365582 RepID=UPI00371DA5CA